MSKHMTIVNLACTITKVRKWGESWKHTAQAASAASAEMHRKHKEAERTVEVLRAERDGLMIQMQNMRDKLWSTDRDLQGYYAEIKELRAQIAEHERRHAAPTCESGDSR